MGWYTDDIGSIPRQWLINYAVTFVVSLLSSFVLFCLFVVVVVVVVLFLLLLLLLLFFD